MGWNYWRMQDMNRGKLLRLIGMTAIMLSWALVVEAANPIPQSERNILLALYSSTNGSSWTNNEGWGEEPGTECTWFGITCFVEGDQETGTNHVAIIGLYHNNLSGFVPAQLGNLTSLQSLDLDENQLTGSIPPELGNMTNLTVSCSQWQSVDRRDSIRTRQSTNLTGLLLYNNQLTGSIPPELGNLTNLQVSHSQWQSADRFDSTRTRQSDQPAVSPPLRNQLTGSIPPGLGNLIQAEGSHPPRQSADRIDSARTRQSDQPAASRIHGNQLTGSIPPELGNLTNLQYLYLPSIS